MIKHIKPFGYHTNGKNIGEVWIDLVKMVLENGNVCFDEKRKRLALTNVRLKSLTQIPNDAVITKYGNPEKINAMVEMTFDTNNMTDIDIVPSFTKKAKSYHQRILDGKFIEFVVNRLSLIPESKKAVIVFPNNEDYKMIMENHNNDYLPCIVSIQFRLRNKTLLDTTFYARSMDVFQKGNGNLVAISLLTKKISELLSKKMKRIVVPGELDGLIADCHIYNETFSAAKDMIKRFKSNN